MNNIEQKLDFNGKVRICDSCILPEGDLGVSFLEIDDSFLCKQCYELKTNLLNREFFEKQWSNHLQSILAKRRKRACQYEVALFGNSHEFKSDRRFSC